MSVIYIYRDLQLQKLPLSCLICFFHWPFLFLFYFPFLTPIPLRKGGQMRHETEEFREDLTGEQRARI